jgi:hypothetical protein
MCRAVIVVERAERVCTVSVIDEASIKPNTTEPGGSGGVDTDQSPLRMENIALRRCIIGANAIMSVKFRAARNG